MREQHFAGVQFLDSVKVGSIAFGRDNTNASTDGSSGKFTVQYSIDSVDEFAPDSYVSRASHCPQV